MAELQIMASSLAAHWESQWLVSTTQWTSDGGLEGWRQEAKGNLYNVLFPTRQPVGSEGWWIYWAAAEEVGQSTQSQQPQNKLHVQARKSADRLSVKDGETKTLEMTAVPPSSCCFSFTQYSLRAYSSTQKNLSDWIHLSA